MEYKEKRGKEGEKEKKEAKQLIFKVPGIKPY